MSKESISEILAKAITNQEYRDVLFAKPDVALAGYNLTEEEVNALKKIDRETFDSAAAELKDRVLKAGGDPSGIDAILLSCNGFIPAGSFVDALDLSNLFRE